jgi:hypothetical protein
VTFDVIDWSAGTASATAYAAGRQMVSRVGITAADGEITLDLNRLGDPAGFIELSGAAANMVDVAADTLMVSATVPNVPFLALNSPAGTDWSVKIPPATACTLVALDLADPVWNTSGRGFATPTRAWQLIEQPAVSVPTTVDIDFASPVAGTIVAGSMVLPTRAESLLHGPHSYGWVDVTSKSSAFNLLIGETASVDINADGTALDYEVNLLRPTGVDDPVTLYLVLADGNASSFSWVYAEGWPTAGPHDPGFLDAPVIVTPASPTTHYPLHDPLAWQLFDTDVQAAVLLVRDVASHLITAGPNDLTHRTVPWIVLAPDGATGLTVPQPPSAVSMDDVLGTGVAVGFVRISRRDAGGTYDAKVAVSKWFLVAP